VSTLGMKLTPCLKQQAPFLHSSEGTLNKNGYSKCT
jgi:hypothetical protein